MQHCDMVFVDKGEMWDESQWPAFLEKHRAAAAQFLPEDDVQKRLEQWDTVSWAHTV